MRRAHLSYGLGQALPGLPLDIPVPPDELDLRVGGAGDGVYSFSPGPEDVSPALAAELLSYYIENLDSEEWALKNKKVADDGGWTAGWSKDDRLVRLTFAPSLLGDDVSLTVEQCPPLIPVKCKPSTLFPLSESGS